jgi:hypothetical protein
MTMTINDTYINALLADASYVSKRRVCKMIYLAHRLSNFSLTKHA